MCANKWLMLNSYCYIETLVIIQLCANKRGKVNGMIYAACIFMPNRIVSYTNLNYFK